MKVRRGGEITANHLIVLACIARCGSLTAATRLLGKTQPAISAQLKQLTQAVGEPVMHRHRYGVRLTAAGASLLPYAQACVRAIEGAGQAAQRLSGLVEGRLVVLASTSVAVYMLPAALAAFHARFPGIDLITERHNGNSAMRKLEAGEGDLAIVRDSGAATSNFTANLVTRILMDDETLLVVTPAHALARRTRLQPRDLHGLEIVDREATSATRALIEALARRAGITFKVKFRTVGVEALKEAVLQGFGAGFSSRLAVQREIQAGVLVGIPIAAPELNGHVTLAYPAAGQCSPAVPRFIEALETAHSATRGASQKTRAGASSRKR